MFETSVYDLTLYVCSLLICSVGSSILWNQICICVYQIVSLGAGFDSAYFRLKAEGLLQDAAFYEVGETDMYAIFSNVHICVFSKFS